VIFGVGVKEVEQIGNQCIGAWPSRHAMICVISVFSFGPANVGFYCHGNGDFHWQAV
jgi:hypothetical protein